jgi:hypothetical protein
MNKDRKRGLVFFKDVIGELESERLSEVTGGRERGGANIIAPTDTDTTKYTCGSCSSETVC